MVFGFRSAEMKLDKCYEASLFSCGYTENIIYYCTRNTDQTSEPFGNSQKVRLMLVKGGGCLRIRLLQNQICNDLTCHIDLKTHQKHV